MLHVNFNAYNKYVTDSLYQWDTNQELVISGLGLSVSPEIHFTNAEMERALVRQASTENGIISVRIPNSLLQSKCTVKAYIGVYEGETFKVIETVEIPIIARTKPADYRLEASDEEFYSFNYMETTIKNETEKIENALEQMNEILNNMRVAEGVEF